MRPLQITFRPPIHKGIICRLVDRSAYCMNHPCDETITTGSDLITLSELMRLAHVTAPSDRNKYSLLAKEQLSKGPQ